jgi:hypothetical protein
MGAQALPAALLFLYWLIGYTIAIHIQALALSPLYLIVPLQIISFCSPFCCLRPRHFFCIAFMVVQKKKNHAEIKSKSQSLTFCIKEENKNSEP